MKNHKLLQRSALSLSICAILHSPIALSNPSGAQIINGQVSIIQNNNTTNITASSGAIINWQDFSIGQNEITRFIQQNSQSTVLNRVIGQNPSQILGQLISNGHVFLINPNGVLFGANSVINTQSLLASTLNISNQDFLSGNYHFSAGSSAGSILNEGIIRAGENGNIVLIAPDIENSGVIQTDGGKIVLAAGQELTLTSLDNPDIRFQVQSPENSVLNLGQILTKGGAIDLFAGTITHSGEINSENLVLDASGNISLKTKQDITVTSTASISANAAEGGQVNIESAEGDTIIRGTISAKGNSGSGGSIQVLGERVALLGNASLDASGESGGGTILVGGDYQGKNTSIKNASQTVVSNDVSIDASAKTSGDGGRVIVWADGFTEFHGDLDISAGSQSGDGGFAEVSGKENLVYRGRINASSSHGQAGSVLFDPKNITIINSQGDGSTPLPVDQITPFSDTPSTDLTIDLYVDEGLSGTGPPSFIESLANGTNYIFQANNDIPIETEISGENASHGNGGDLTFLAGRSIFIKADITTDGGDFTAIANSTVADGVINSSTLGHTTVINREAGAATIEVGDFGSGTAATINTSNLASNTNSGHGNIKLQIKDGAGLTNNTAGDIIIDTNSTLKTRGGTIELLATTGFITVSSGASVLSGNETAGTSSTGAITIQADKIDIDSTGSISTLATSLSRSNVSISTFSTDRNMAIGTSATGLFSLSKAELGTIQAAELTIGSNSTNTTGTMTISDSLINTDINASTLTLKANALAVGAGNSIDLTGPGNKNLKLVANRIDITDASIDANSVTVETDSLIISLAGTTNTVHIDSLAKNIPENSALGGGGTLAAPPSFSSQRPHLLDFDGGENGVLDFRSGSRQFENVTLQSGTIKATGSNQLFSVRNDFNWSGGYIQDFKSINTVGTTNISDSVLVNTDINNYGTLNWSAGNIESADSTYLFTNEAEAIVNISSSANFSGLNFDNKGTLTKSSNTGTTTFAQAFTNSGTVNANSGTLDFTSGYTQTAGLTRLVGGNMSTSLGLSGVSANFNGGTLSGIGTFSSAALNINSGATLSAGQSPGTFFVTGNLNLAPGSTTLIEVAGTTPGTFDVINVSGDLQLGGTLNVVEFNGFTVVNHQYTIFDSSAITGSFATFTTPYGGSLSGGDLTLFGVAGPVVAVSSGDEETSVAATSSILTLTENDGVKDDDDDELSGELDNLVGSNDDSTQQSDETVLQCS